MEKNRLFRGIVRDSYRVERHELGKRPKAPERVQRTDPTAGSTRCRPTSESQCKVGCNGNPGGLECRGRNNLTECRESARRRQARLALRGVHSLSFREELDPNRLDKEGGSLRQV